MNEARQNNLRYFAIAFLITLLALLFFSCTTQRRCTAKFPPQVTTVTKDSIITRDSVVYRDRIVLDTIKGDTVYTEVTLPATTDPRMKALKTAKLNAENEYASASAWIENMQLKLELRLKEQVIERKLKDAEKETMHWKELYHTVLTKETPKPVKYKPLAYRVGFWYMIITLLLLGTWLTLKIRKRLV